MKVLLVNGSPHKEGCTYQALNEVSGALKNEGISTDFYWIGDEPITGCVACRSCMKTKRCRYDDSVNKFLDIAGEYDGFLFGSPVHFAAASGSMTSFLDRAFYTDLCGRGNRFLLKPAAAVVVARRAGNTATLDQINKYFGLMQMPIISSKYWNMVHGARPEDVQQDIEGLQTMRILGKNMAYFLKCKELATNAGLTMPEQEPPTFTNFIRD